MQVTTNKLLRLLDRDKPAEVRCAAALVLAEVGVRDTQLANSLCECLQDEEAEVRLQAIKAVGKLRIDKALSYLLERIKGGGEEADLAAQAAARLGSKGTRALQELMPKVAPGLRRYIAAALAVGGTASAETAAVAVLLDGDPGVVEAAVRSLVGQIPTLESSQRRAWTDQLLQLLDEPKAPLSAASEAAVVRLLVALDDPRAEALLWDRTLPPHPPEVRTAALQALGKWVTSPGKDQLQRLFRCAADRDFRVAAPALMVLKNLPVNPRTVPEWLSLLEAPDGTVRQVAVEKLGDRDSDEVANALMQQLRHPDRALREAALARLAGMKHGRTALTGALLEAESADQAWSLARTQAPFAKEFPSEWRQAVFTQAGKYLEASDRRAEPLWFLLREADPEELSDRLEQKASSWRKKQEYEKALAYLRLLARDPACGLPIRLELAACGLKVSGHELAAEARASDPCLQQFASLCQQHGEGELFQRLEKVKWLEPEDLYYLGFHFAERQGPFKKFAAEVLHLLLKRSPRSKLSQDARSKLRREGLE
jgi:HEAT repeat protein